MKRMWARAKAGLKQAGRWIARVCTPSEAAWSAASWALLAVWGFLILSFLLQYVVPRFGLGNLLGVAVTFAVFALIGLGVVLAARVLALLRPRYRLALGLVVPPLVMLLMNVWDKKGMAIATALLVVGASLAAGSAAALLRKGRARRPYGAAAFLALGVVALAVLAAGILRAPKNPNPALANYRLAGATLPMPDPGKPGAYQVLRMTYGGGTDRYRPEFAAGADWRSHPVDGSKLDAEWKGLGGKMRSFYWGFGPKTFPVQGRVWAPRGEGPFPLVLIVHGNHEMQDFSDPGYAYLGELLASQGFILVSVDENFLNAAMDDMVNPFKRRNGAENDARGWLLLEHLVQWRGWNADPKNPLYGKVDMDHIGVIGHSRGGEAVAVAAAFNGLEHYPDDATLPFNYHFKLGAVAAIAPADGQYKARDRPTPLKDVSYFVIQGSLDGDVSSFMGSSQYSRDKLTGEVPAFKAQAYVKDADHNQFNTGWGRNDLGLPWEFLLDERSLLPPEAQRQIAKVYLSAFLQTTLMGKGGYRPLFQDPRRGAAWLPKGYIVADYADSGTAWAATFDEDLDPGTAAAPGAAIVGRNLSVWRESDVKLKWNPLDTNVALVGWDERVGKGASYSVDLGRAAAAAGPGADLVFSAADAGVSSLPKDFKPVKAKTKAREKADKGPLDWTVVLVDAKGAEARVPLSRDQVLYPQIKGRTRVFPEIDGAKPSEVVMRRYRLPLAAFAAANPALDLGSLKAMRFDFDRSKRGVIALDDVGVSPAG
jgi:dienelactone hydrolase/cytochrome c oxidase subunit IV